MLRKEQDSLLSPSDRLATALKKCLPSVRRSFERYCRELDVPRPWALTLTSVCTDPDSTLATLPPRWTGHTSLAAYQPVLEPTAEKSKKRKPADREGAEAGAAQVSEEMRRMVEWMGSTVALNAELNMTQLLRTLDNSGGSQALRTLDSSGGYSPLPPGRSFAQMRSGKVQQTANHCR